jgi:hypothetical protein
MKINCLLIIGLLLIFSCDKKEENKTLLSENWSKRSTIIPTKDSLAFGKSYLSIYSQIYSYSEHKTHDLTAMVSLRNTSDTDTIYISRAEYYDTHGVSIKKYLEKPIFLAPVETIEIIINEQDISGGTGSNFIFEWNTPIDSSEPLFEGVMTSTLGQQGLSFTTQGIRVK